MEPIIQTEDRPLDSPEETAARQAGERTERQRRAIKQRGILLATGGLALTLSILLAFGVLGIAELRFENWLLACGATLLVQLVLWLIPRTGLSERIHWDPHYLLIPMAAAALLLGYYTYLVPEGRYLLLMAWFVALLFMAGLADFMEVVTLGVVMTASWLAALALGGRIAVDVPVEYQVIEALVFLAIQIYAGFVFERLRSDRHKMAELRGRLAEQAITDPLTEMANRRYFEEFLRSELARIDRYGGSCAVAMVDVDRFKNYNDTVGHPAGDEVLRQLSGILEQICRDADLVARYGGEEFTLVLPATETEEALESAERLRAAVEAHAFPHEEIQPGGQVTVSVGVAAYPEDADTMEDVVNGADRALYLAKEEGRNRVRSVRDL